MNIIKKYEILLMIGNSDGGGNDTNDTKTVC